jgi:hypothetical protein
VLLLGFLPQSQVMRGMGVFCAIFGFRSVAPLACSFEEGFIGTTGENTGGLRKRLNRQAQMAFLRRDATRWRKTCNGFGEEMRRFCGRVATMRAETLIFNIN